MDTLPNRSEELPEKRFYDPQEDDNWADILHEVLAELSVNALVSSADPSNHTPEDGTLFVPEDGASPLYLGDGDNWVELGELIDEQRVEDLETGLAAHESDATNPHNVDSNQVGAVPESGGTFTGDVAINADLNVTGTNKATDSERFDGWQYPEIAYGRRTFRLRQTSGESSYVHIATFDSSLSVKSTFTIRNATGINDPAEWGWMVTIQYRNGNCEPEWYGWGSERRRAWPTVTRETITDGDDIFHFYIDTEAYTDLVGTLEGNEQYFPQMMFLGEYEDSDGTGPHTYTPTELTGDIVLDGRNEDPNLPFFTGSLEVTDTITEAGERVATRSWSDGRFLQTSGGTVTGDLDVTGDLTNGGEPLDTGRSTIRAVDHGADPSGASSSAQALQDAVDAASEGDTVVWGEPGTYYLDAEITITKRIELDLHEGIIESDYHDEQAYPNDQGHYMPLFRVHGTIGTSDTLAQVVDRGEDQVVVNNPSEFSEGEGVLLRTATTNRTTIPAYDYMVTQSRIREIQDGVIYLEDNATYDFSVGDYLTHCEYVERPILRNINIRPRTEPAFDSTAGKVLGGFRHGIATEVCDRPHIENVSAVGYDSHLWTSRDDLSPTLIDGEAREPMNLSGSCGEPLHVQSSNDVSIVRPVIKEARRAVDIRSGCGTVTVDEPDITGVSFVGLSWHSISLIEADMVVNGGRVEAKPDDPTMDNQDGSLDQRQEVQAGRPFNTAEGGKLVCNDVVFVGRQNSILNGPADITGGEIYKYRTAGTVLTLNGEGIAIEGTKIGSLGRVDSLVQTEVDSNARNCVLRDVTLDTSGNPSRAVEFLSGEHIDVSGYVGGDDTATAGIDLEGGTNLSFDLDMDVTGNYAYIIYAGVDGVDIAGRIDGACQNEVIELQGGTDIDIDAEIHASGGGQVRGVRLFDTEDVDITGTFRGPGIGVMFSGGAVSTTIHDMRIEVTSTSRPAAVGTDGAATGLQIVKWMSNDLRGEVDDILMNDDVNGFWAVDNVTSGVSTTTGSTGVHTRDNYMI